MAKRGPKTPEGKLAVRWNAIKHGLTSQSPVVSAFESEEAWTVHLREVWDELAPASYLEESLVRRIAGLLWRLRRIEIFERAVVEYNENFSIFDYYAKRRAYGLTNLDPQEKSKELKEKAHVLGLLIDVRESPGETPIDGKDVGIILKTITAARKDIVIEQEALIVTCPQ
jgi:hypothetical protein